MSSVEQNPYHSSFGQLAAHAETWERVDFIRRTYLHLAAAIAAFVTIETVIFALVPAATLDALMATVLGGQYSWLIVLGGFMAVSWVADSWARSNTSKGMQYLGLGLYVVAEAFIFVPLLYIASQMAPQAIPAAGIVTMVTFGGLSAYVLITRTDLSGIGKYLFLAGMLALGLIVCAVLFGFALGTWFSVLMIGLASGYILYTTSNIVHHYRTDQHVAAALALFASVALLFWYVLQLFMSRD